MQELVNTAGRQASTAAPPAVTQVQRTARKDVSLAAGKRLPSGKPDPPPDGRDVPVALVMPAQRPARRAPTGWFFAIRASCCLFLIRLHIAAKRNTQASSETGHWRCGVPHSVVSALTGYSFSPTGMRPLSGRNGALRNGHSFSAAP